MSRLIQYILKYFGNAFVILSKNTTPEKRIDEGCAKCAAVVQDVL